MTEQVKVKYEPKEVPVNEGWEGYVLAEAIYKLAGGKRLLLLREGWKLSSSNIRSLQTHGIKTMKVMAEKSRRNENNKEKQEVQTESNQDEEGG